MEKEKELNQLVEKLKAAAGANLKAVVLYGSAAAGEFQRKYSDLNVLCVVERLGAAEMDQLNPAVTWWVRRRQPPPMVFTLEELRRSADVFAIELLDIQASHRVLYGEDVFAGMEIPMKLHRVQVERELRTQLVRLREHYLATPRNAKKLLRLMTASVSTFATLFRHALITLGEQAPQPKRAVVDRLASVLGFDAAAFHTVLDVREGKKREKEVDAAPTFRAYLEGVVRVVEEVDRRFHP